MKLNWFTRRGLIYWPASIMGWVILILAAAYAVYAFIDADSRSHSNSDTLINFVFSLLIIGLVYNTIGYFTEVRPQMSRRDE